MKYDTNLNFYFKNNYLNVHSFRPLINIECRYKQYSFYLNFQVLTAASTKMIACCDIALCSLEVDRRFRGA
jgi:hypothetical protein